MQLAPVHTRPCVLRPALRLLAWAAALAGTAAQAAITTSGAIWSDPAPLVLGPGSTVWIGGGGSGALGVDGGSFLQLARLSFGAGHGSGSGTITGAGTRVELVGNGVGGQTQRLLVGDNGTGSLLVFAGATLDTSVQAGPCLLQFHYCDSFVGAAAGDSASLTLSGTGTLVRIGGQLFVGHPGFTPPTLGNPYGSAGATVSATVHVLDGAELRTDRAQIGTSQWDTGSTGFERSVSNVLIDGAGSRWVSVGGQTWDGVSGATVNPGSGILTASDRFAVANIDIRHGGQMRVDGVPGVSSYLNLTTGGGRTDMSVSGAGSSVQFNGENAVLQVGRQLGSAELSVLQGAQASGMWYVSVGRDGSFGQLNVDGAGSSVLIDGAATASANGVSASPVLDIGRGGGKGLVTVSAGGQIHLRTGSAQASGMVLNLGRDANSAGTLNIQGQGSLVLLESLSVLPGGGAGETLNPTVRVGRDGTGALNITDGGQLLLEGGAVSTPANRRSTSLFVGGLSDTANGGFGIATVSGPGSEIRLSGTDTFVGVGIGPQSSGQLTVGNGGLVSAIGMGVGRSGGVGVLTVDNASLSFSGQQTAGNLSGAFLTVGTGGSVGVATITNGSRVTLSNAGSAGAGLSLGGSGAFPGGDGSLTLSGGSQIQVQAASGLGAVTVGREGSGLLRIKGASSLDVGDGHLFLGRLAGSDGTLIASEGSSVSAGWVGIGRNRINGGDEDGGSGTLILINSTLTAKDIVIGSKGFLCGTGAINGNVVNHGIFCPGNSPGTVRLNGSYSSAPGGRMVLEVQDAGDGRYLTDAVVFGGAVDLTGLQIEFRFLGATDPTAFRDSGKFDVDTFLGRDDGAGGLLALGDESFKNVNFSASAERYLISDFRYSAAGGAVFTAQAVPEPQHWALLLAGLAALALRARGQRGRALG